MAVSSLLCVFDVDGRVPGSCAKLLVWYVGCFIACTCGCNWVNMLSRCCFLLVGELAMGCDLCVGWCFGVVFTLGRPIRGLGKGGYCPCSAGMLIWICVVGLRG